MDRGEGRAPLRDPRERREDALREAGAGAPQSQRIARLHLCRGWGTRIARPRRRLAAVDAELRATLEALARGARRHARGRRRAAGSRENQLRLPRARPRARLEGGARAARELELVAKTGDNILESMERVARPARARARA